MVDDTGLISIHAPRVGRDAARRLSRSSQRYFNPRAPCGARHPRLCGAAGGRDFNPRAPCGARLKLNRLCYLTEDFNPRAPCGARRVVSEQIPRRMAISIHAPRVGRDCKPLHRDSDPKRFQSTRPVWGATPIIFAGAAIFTSFQSTRPVWGATANLTILPRQICTKGTKEFLLGRKTHGKKEK